jgi:hypothetical protein
MKKVAESGHIKNVALYDKIVVDAEETGSSYNPAANDIKIANLILRRDEIHNAMEALDIAEAEKDQAINQRQFIYVELLDRSSRLVGEAVACGADEKILADIRTLIRKLRGKRAKAIVEPIVDVPPADGTSETGKVGSDLATKVKRSVSQQGFDNRLGHFRKIIEILGQISGYAPNEAEMSIVGLKTLSEEAFAATKSVNQKIHNLNVARTLRDKLLYRKGTGLVFMGERIKGYFKATFGPNSNEFKKIKDVRFKRYEFSGL